MPTSPTPRSRTLSAAILLVLLHLGPAARADDTLIANGAVWKYLDDGSNPGTAWVAVGFNDTAWKQGPAQLGYGDGDEATVVSYGPSSSAKYVTTYFRRQFGATNPGHYLGLVLRMVRDDGAVVYLNGVEVARSNLPAGSIGTLTKASYGIGGPAENLRHYFRIDPALLVAGVNQLAVEMHQSSVTSSDLSFDLELLGETSLKVSRGPYLQLGTPAGVTVCWRTNAAANGRVRYGAAPGNLTGWVDDPTVALGHQVSLSGLAPNTRYYYSVGSTSTVLAGDDPQHTFVTAPAPGTEAPTRIWVLGDSGTADANAAAVRDAYNAFTGTTPTDLWLMLGDNAYDTGADSEYHAAVFETYPQMLRSSVLWPTRGNHEMHADDHYDIFHLPTLGEAGGVPSGTEAYYSFDHANVHFICLDSAYTDRSVGGVMWNWLQADLAATGQHWIIAFFHHPPYTKGSHDSDTEQTLVEIRSNFVPLLEAGGVDLVLCGHSHGYERSFFIDGHYGTSSTFAAAHLKDTGNGQVTGDGPYAKAALPHAGAVYVVAGSSGKLGSGPLDHKAILFSKVTYGSVVLDVVGDRLDAAFLTSTGQVLDQFTLRKYADAGLTGDTTTLSVGFGGTQNLALAAGPGHAGKPYFLVGSMSGSEPGFPVNSVVLPLLLDSYTLITIQAANTSIFWNNFGTTGPAGTASAAITFPPGLAGGLVGRTLYHAYVLFDPPPASTASFASNPVPLTLLP